MYLFMGYFKKKDLFSCIESQLWHMGSSSQTRDQTHTSLHEELRVLVPGLPWQSLFWILITHTFMHVLSSTYSQGHAMTLCFLNKLFILKHFQIYKKVAKITQRIPTYPSLPLMFKSYRPVGPLAAPRNQCWHVVNNYPPDFTQIFTSFSNNILYTFQNPVQGPRTQHGRIVKE